MIKQINFNGIKNIGYVHVVSDNDDAKSARFAMNMELTDDDGNKDLSEFKKFIAQNPMLKNEINDKFVNVEVETSNLLGYDVIMTKLNGKNLNLATQNEPIINYLKGLVHRVANFKEKDFKLDDGHNFSKEANEGLLYNEYMADYITGYSGRLTLLEGSGLTEKFDLYWNGETADDEPETDEMSEEEEMINDAMDGVIQVLHHPAYVHNGAVIMDSILKSYSEFFQQYS